VSIERVQPPGWPASVLALTTTREGGFSAPPYDSFNLGLHVGDEPGAVLRNRRHLQEALPQKTRIQWLSQVHGTAVVPAGGEALSQADACFSDRPGRACAILTADCLPVLFCSRDGQRVAAAHAGWRGLAAGVLEATVAAMGRPAEELLAWLGPCIGPGAFVVGAEVRAAFEAGLGAQARNCFVPAPEKEGRFLADLPALARAQLARAGLRAINGSDACTCSDPKRYFSYRRDGNTGRMATLITRLD